MIIAIDATWRITSDINQWKVERRNGTDKEGNEIWTPRTFHTTFAAARKRLADMMVMSSDAEGLEAAIEAVMDIKSRLEVALDSVVGE